MMTSVSGVRGIGKTFHLADEVYRRAKRGYFIITNFHHLYSNVDCSELDPYEFIEVLRQVLLFKEMGYEMYDIFPGFRHTGVFIAIDEAHLYFSADEWHRYSQFEGFSDMIKLLAQARKQDVEIWYTVQDPAKIDKNWRRYTEDWVRITPIIPLRYKKNVKHKNKPIFQREIRYFWPMFWFEVHDLDPGNPVFNYNKIQGEEGTWKWDATSTIRYRRIRTGGYLNPFPYKLYNHNQVIAVKKPQEEETDFGQLKKRFAWVPQTYRPDNFPTFKKWLGMKTNHDKYPVRFKMKKIPLHNPEIIDHINSGVFDQAHRFIEGLTAWNEYKRIVSENPSKERSAWKRVERSLFELSRKDTIDTKAMLDKNEFEGGVTKHISERSYPSTLILPPTGPPAPPAPPTGPTAPPDSVFIFSPLTPMGKKTNSVPVGNQESKAEKFARLANSRVTIALKRIKLLSALSNRSQYEYTEEQVNKIFDALADALAAVRKKYESGSNEPDEPDFSV